MSFRLSTRPETVPAYQLRLYPLSLERSALLAAAALQERYALESIQTSYEEERAKVEEEWKRGRERIRERLLDGIEERRRRAREEKDGEGAAGGAYLPDCNSFLSSKASQMPLSTLNRVRTSHANFGS